MTIIVVITIKLYGESEMKKLPSFSTECTATVTYKIFVDNICTHENIVSFVYNETTTADNSVQIADNMTDFIMMREHYETFTRLLMATNTTSAYESAYSYALAHSVVLMPPRTAYLMLYGAELPNTDLAPDPAIIKCESTRELKRVVNLGYVPFKYSETVRDFIFTGKLDIRQFFKFSINAYSEYVPRRFITRLTLDNVTKVYMDSVETKLKNNDNVEVLATSALLTEESDNLSYNCGVYIIDIAVFLPKELGVKMVYKIPNEIKRNTIRDYSVEEYEQVKKFLKISNKKVTLSDDGQDSLDESLLLVTDAKLIGWSKKYVEELAGVGW